jgi:peptidyl-prolyl cis-trans isomerase C
MLRSRIPFAAIGLAMVMTGCGQGKDPVLAKVGKDPITATDFKNAYLAIKPKERPPLATLNDKKQFLDDLISKAVMEHLAFAKYPELTERQQWRLIRFREKELTDAVRKRLIRNAVVVTPAMKDWLFDHMKEERNLRAMLIADADAAKWVRGQLDEGADFGALARDHSTQWVSHTNKGDLGWKQPGNLFPYPVEVEVWNAPVGSRLGPIERPLGSYLVEVLGARPVAVPAGQTRQGMDRALEEKLMEQMYFERQMAVQDSLNAAADPYYPAGAKALLNMKYYVDPPADAALNPTWKLDMDRVIPTFTAAEDTIVAVDFKNAPDWTVKDFAQRLSWYPTGMWPFGESEEQLVESMNLVVRDYLYLKAAQDLGYDNAAFARKLENMRHEMRVTYFYYNDIVSKFSPNQGEIDAYFTQHRDVYKAPPSYKLAFFGSRNKPLIEKLAQDWKKGTSFTDLRARYERSDSSLFAVGETEWLYTGQDELRDGMVEALKEGEISSPTIRADESMVFQLIARRAERLPPYAEIKDQVDKEAKDAIIDAKLTALLDQERKKEGVKLNEHALAKIEIPKDAPVPAETAEPSAPIRNVLKLHEGSNATPGQQGP